LLRNPTSERRVRDCVHGHNDHPAKEAAEKGGDPLAGVFSPEEDTIPFPYAERSETRREMRRRVEQARVRPANGSIAAPEGDGGFAGRPRIFAEVFENGLPGHGPLSFAHPRGGRKLPVCGKRPGRDELPGLL
jgi:hypothetical protein